ncbi:MAG: hypothetical protein Q9168_002187 [Polycauliona sp. 1 TL-2023]
MAKAQETPLATEPQPLPKLSPSEFRIYNSMADHMDLYHNHFRQTWNGLYTAASRGQRPQGTTLRQFVNGGLQFCESLHLHHSIEERHIFPVLARKMPAFRKELELLTQHKLIHAGLDQFQAYLEGCAKGERDLSLTELKALMDGFGTVLWAHLNDEVQQLGAENMRKYWTPAEMKSMPM